MKKNRLHKYLSLYRIPVRSITAYKSDLVIEYILCIVAFVIQYSIWTAVYRNVNSIRNLDLTYMITFFALVSFTRFFRSSVEGMIAQRINTGMIVFELTRPMNFIGYYLFQYIYRCLVKLLVISVPLFLVAKLLIPLYVPTNPTTIGLFLLSMCNAFLINNFFGVLFGMSTVFVKKNMGLIIFKNSLISILSGALIPIHFYPKVLQNLANLLPFKGLVQIPFDIYLEQVDLLQAVHYIGFQLFWVVVFGIIAMVYVGYCVRKMEILGG